MAKEIQPGFYYHYKHNPEGVWNNYLYEVLNIAHHTEIKDINESIMVVYRPIYNSFVYENGKHWDVRPLGMFMEKVIKDGIAKDRFTLITDPELIEKAKKLAEEMY